MCPYFKLFWYVFSRIRLEYREILRISPYSVRMQGNTDQINSKYGHLLRNTDCSEQDGIIIDFVRSIFIKN